MDTSPIINSLGALDGSSLDALAPIPKSASRGEELDPRVAKLVSDLARCKDTILQRGSNFFIQEGIALPARQVLYDSIWSAFTIISSTGEDSGVRCATLSKLWDERGVVLAAVAANPRLAEYAQLSLLALLYPKHSASVADSGSVFMAEALLGNLPPSPVTTATTLSAIEGDQVEEMLADVRLNRSIAGGPVAHGVFLTDLFARTNEYSARFLAIWLKANVYEERSAALCKLTNRTIREVVWVATHADFGIYERLGAAHALGILAPLVDWEGLPELTELVGRALAREPSEAESSNNCCLSYQHSLQRAAALMRIPELLNIYRPSNPIISMSPLYANIDCKSCLALIGEGVLRVALDRPEWSPEDRRLVYHTVEGAVIGLLKNFANPSAAAGNRYRAASILGQESGWVDAVLASGPNRRFVPQARCVLSSAGGHYSGFRKELYEIEQFLDRVQRLTRH